MSKCYSRPILLQLGPITPSAGDGLSFAVSYISSTNQWELYAADTAQSKYIYSYVTVGSGSGEIPYAAGSNMPFGMMISEGTGTTASNQIPAGVNFYDIIGTSSSGTYTLAGQSPVDQPSSGSQSVTLVYNTGTCTWGSNTCGSQDIIVG